MHRVFLRSPANPDSEGNPARLSTFLNLSSDVASCEFTVAVWCIKRTGFGHAQQEKVSR